MTAENGVAVNVVESPVELTETKFNFKEDKKTGSKRDQIVANIPLLTVQGLVQALEAGGKQLDLVLEAANAIILQQARSILNDYPDITTENFSAKFPQEQLTWEFISNIEPKARTGGGIPSEVWEAWAEDYVKVMPAATGKTVDQVAAAAKIMLSKFAGQFKFNQKVHVFSKEQLGIYLATSSNAEEYAPCVDFLLNKIESLMNMKEEDLLANL